MEQLNFTFKKNRSVGDLISDYISLFKQVFKHFSKTLFTIALPFIALFFLIAFFSVGYLSSSFSSLGPSNGIVALPAVLFSQFFIIILFFIFNIIVSAIGIEYMFLLEKNGNTNFTIKDVTHTLKVNIGKYILFFLASIVVGIILIIPIGLIGIVLAFIPIIGQFALVFIGAIIGLFISCALLLYRQGRATLWGSYMASFELIREKIFSYALATFLFQILAQVFFGILTIIPVVILFIIGFTTIGFNNEFFLSFTGKFLISIGAGIATLFMFFYGAMLISFYVLEYFSLLEVSYSEETLDEIEQIGSNPTDKQ